MAFLIVTSFFMRALALSNSEPYRIVGTRKILVPNYQEKSTNQYLVR